MFSVLVDGLVLFLSLCLCVLLSLLYVIKIVLLPSVSTFIPFAWTHVDGFRYVVSLFCLCVFAFLVTVLFDVFVVIFPLFSFFLFQPEERSALAFAYSCG